LVQAGTTGNNLIDKSASSNEVIVYALGGNDTVTGGSSNDTLFGQVGNDSLNGGLGADVLVGGDGNDVYVVDNLGDVVDESGTGTDRLETTLNSYSLVGLAAVENLTFTGTGNFAGTGNDLRNAIIGGLGNDTITGGAGNDTITGGGGIDLAAFSGSVDAYSFSLTGSNLVVADTRPGAPDGTDTLIGFNGENVQFSGQTFRLVYGSNNANGTTAAPVTGTAGRDLVLGLGGNDIIAGGTGDDALVGGSGRDTAMFGGVLNNFSFSFDAAGHVVVTDTVGEGGTDMLIGVEQVRFNTQTFTLEAGTSGDDTRVGTSAAQLFLGGDGNDSFVFGPSTNTANHDVIVDFTDHTGPAANRDVINFSAIDAHSGSGVFSGNQTFTFIDKSNLGPMAGPGYSGTDHLGQLVYYLDSTTAHYLLAGNTTESDSPEFVIDLGINLMHLTGGLDIIM
jgi:Ca2+-binding RTX toxin-like protein